MLTDAQYLLILNTPFVYLTHPGPLIIPDGTTVHANSNMINAHTEEVILFRKVTGIKQDLLQQIFATVKKEYLAGIQNCTTHSIRNTVADVLTHLQENYGQLMPHKILERQDIVKKMTYHPQDPIATVFSAFKEFLEFADRTITS